jgi:hypothetical protein
MTRSVMGYSQEFASDNGKLCLCMKSEFFPGGRRQEELTNKAGQLPDKNQTPKCSRIGEKSK